MTVASAFNAGDHVGGDGLRFDQRRVVAEGDFFAGVVDVGCRYAVYFFGAAFDSGDAVGAGHAHDG